jgi:beta-phosphoglucomutase
MENRMNIQLVMFDLDGVLVDACEWHYESLNRALIEVGCIPISREDHLTKYNGLPTKIKLEMFGLDKSISKEVWNLKQKYTLEIIRENEKCMEEKIELHSYLKSKGIKIACVTNSIRETAEAMLKATCQWEWIDLLLTNEDVQRNKPYPDCYNLAIEKMGISANNCLCVEDSPKGIQSALDSNAKWLWKVRDTHEVNLKSYRSFIHENTNTDGRRG